MSAFLIVIQCICLKIIFFPSFLKIFHDDGIHGIYKFLSFKNKIIAKHFNRLKSALFNHGGSLTITTPKASHFNDWLYCTLMESVLYSPTRDTLNGVGVSIPTVGIRRVAQTHIWPLSEKVGQSPQVCQLLATPPVGHPSYPGRGTRSGCYFVSYRPESDKKWENSPKIKTICLFDCFFLGIQCHYSVP